MNIAFIIEQEFNPYTGGVQRSTSKLAKIFIENGHHAIIVSLSKENNSKEWEGVKVYSILIDAVNESFRAISLREEIQLVINQAGYSLKLTRLLLNSAPDAYLINTLRINPLNFYDNHPFIITDILTRKNLALVNNKILHKIILIYHIVKQRFELGFIIKNVDAFVMLSERFKKDLYQLVPSVKKYDYKIFGINNPFNRPIIDISSVKKQNVILHVGRLIISQKRVDLLLKIWEQLHAKLEDWEFWVVGHGDEEVMMRKYCEDRNLRRVMFFGKQNPEAYYKKAKIFHLTSQFEGFGNVLVEAQSYGCVPVLFDSYSAASEIINHESDGVLIDPFDLDNYVSKTLDLTLNPEELHRLSINAYENSTRFSYDRTYTKWNSLFEQLKDNHKE